MSDGVQEQLSALRWHYGPTDRDSNPGSMWCHDCGSEVWIVDDGYICTGCDRQEEGTYVVTVDVDLLLDDVLREMTAGLKPGPYVRDLHCAPDVLSALRRAEAADLPELPFPVPQPGEPLFGHSRIYVEPSMPSGCYEFLENGEVVKSGKLGET